MTSSARSSAAFFLAQSIFMPHLSRPSSRAEAVHREVQPRFPKAPFLSLISGKQSLHAWQYSFSHPARSSFMSPARPPTLASRSSRPRSRNRRSHQLEETFWSKGQHPVESEVRREFLYFHADEKEFDPAQMAAPYSETISPVPNLNHDLPCLLLQPPSEDPENSSE
jgi:hypothetical protein